MKKNLLFLMMLSLGFMLKAQDIDKSAAIELINRNAGSIGLTKEDLKNVIISNAYKSGGADLIYLQQSYLGLPVYNQLQVLAFKNGKLVSNAGGRIAGIENRINPASPTPVVAAESAVRTAMANKKVSTAQSLSPVIIIPGRKLDYGKLDISYENVTAELMWVPVEEGKKVRLAWQVYLVPVTSSDYWMIRVDAMANKVIDENNLTVYCNWDAKDKNICSGNHQHAEDKSIAGSKPVLSDLFDFNNFSKSEQPVNAGPSIVNSGSYRVIPFPAESPKHPGGSHALVTDPWNSAPGNATTLKWHSTGTTDYNITRGNNVWAKEDHQSNNSTTGQPATSTTSPDPLTFNFVPDFARKPNQIAPVPNQQFNITNLFYWVNVVHDVMYQYGFDEPAGNFQSNNLGRGGLGNDFVYGDAQDGNFIAPNQNNANFSTPVDGGNPRMQMYLWDTAVTLTVNSPANIAGTYTAIEGSLSTANKLINIGPVSGQVVYYNDNGAGTTHEACTPPANSLAGKIALIDRATCTFVIKIKNAQDAGAIGVIMVNNVDGLLTMAGNDNTITIPAVCISIDDGDILKAQLANNINVTLYATTLDGDVDNGVIVHEHGHGISNRLTGGPAQAGCLSNAEQMGEGWSDYYSLMFTQNWATSNLNTGFTTPRAIGTYVFGQSPSGTGIRSQKYCTDFTINNLVYAASIDPETHNRGEIWCATLWDMTWNIINQVGTINPNLYNTAGGGGNTIAMRLVTEGLKLQPCSPGFISGKNAILQADSILYGGAYSCVIKEAFRRRGMGQNASQGSSNSVTDQVPDFAVFPCSSCTAVGTTTQPANANACTGNNASFTVAVSGTTPAYQWQVSTNGGATYTNIPAATAATLNLTAVTAVMNNNLYRAIITNTCPSADTSNAALLTVADSAAITAQPVSNTSCIGANASFSVTATGSSNTYQWQVSTDGGITFTNIVGATTVTLNLTAVTAAMNGNQYQVIIISGCNPAGITSTPAILTVNNTASITGQPANTSACTGGGNAVFTVTAAGSSLSYQWQVSTNGGTTFTNIAGATSATLTLSGVTAVMNNNLYQVIVSNTCASIVTSQPALLTVSDPATITSQPASATVCAGSNASFAVTATGTSNTYQWQVSTDGGITFTDLAGATTSTLNLAAVTAGMDGNQYHLVVTSCSPTGLNSSNVTLTVNSPATITAQPAGITSCVGNDATFTATASGTAVTYQWQVSTDGGITYTSIPAANAATLTLTAVTAAMNNNLYQVIVNGVCPPADTSAGALLTVSNNASIATQPTNAVACAGANASFTAVASGLSYQWQVSTDGGTNFSDIPGATLATLDLTAITAAMNNNQYRLVVSSCGGTTLNSTAVTLTVNNPAEITAQPAGATSCIGSDASFTVTATGDSPTYQWEVSTDGGITFTPITGATGATLTLTGVTATMNNNLYHVILSNICTIALTSTAATLNVSSDAVINLQPVSTSACSGATATYSVAATGTGLGYQWQVSSDGGATFTNISGQTGANLTLTGLTDAMNNNQYRAIVSNSCSSTGINSDTVTLTVFALPVVAITASPYTSLSAGLTTTLTATSIPASAVFSWFKDSVQIPGITGNTITVSHNELGKYSASVTDLNGCTNASNQLMISDSGVNITFIYPNPNTGSFHVRFQGIPYNGQPRIITMYDSKGSRVYSQTNVVSSSYEEMDVNAEKLSAGVYMLVLYDVQGNTLATGKVIILQ